MRKLKNMMRDIYREIARYPAFYGCILTGCPLLYVVFLWLENWGDIP